MLTKIRIYFRNRKEKRKEKKRKGKEEKRGRWSRVNTSLSNGVSFVNTCRPSHLNTLSTLFSHLSLSLPFNHFSPSNTQSQLHNKTINTLFNFLIIYLFSFLLPVKYNKSRKRRNLSSLSPAIKRLLSFFKTVTSNLNPSPRDW